ncbi:MAG: LysR substrate-binding domain-containing protein, partial [Planctomycetota bacterium]
YFVAAAESGGMREAARLSHVAQPSLSKQIRKLEEEIGEPLLERSSRGVTLTRAGRSLLPRARAILAEVDDAPRLVRDDLANQPSELRIGAIATMAPYLLPAMVRHTRKHAPAVSVTLREDYTERLVADVATGSLDVAIVSTPITQPRVTVQVLGQEPLLVALPSKHKLAKRKSVSLNDVRDEPIIVLSELHCLGQQIADYCIAQQIGRDVICRTTQLATVLAMVRNGLGIAMVPKMGAASPGVTFLPIRHREGETPSREVAAAWQASRPKHPAALTAVTTLANSLRAT